MDKYEFSIKAEQIKKLIGQEDYKTAMQIADTIDWNRVRSVNLLSSIAEIYEKNGEYEEAKDILLLAFERAPVGKRFLYKLSELSLSSGAIDDAVEFYHEFLDVSPEDPRKYLLQYMILKAKGARAYQLLGPLENYTETELEEQWLYELAKLYGEAGREDDCVRICDKMILLFGMGKYVDKAMDLKLHYRPVKEENDYSAFSVQEEEPKVTEEAVLSKDLEEDEFYDEEDAEIIESAGDASEEEGIKEDTEPEESEVLKREEESEKPQDKSEIEENFHKEEDTVEDSLSIEDIAEDSSASPNYNMIIEAETLEKAFHIAVEEIKYFHKEYGVNFKVAKINADKLNEKGFAAFKDKLQERDLIIESAGKLKYSVLDEIEQQIKEAKDASSIVLIDEIDHFDRLAEDRPKFLEHFDIVSGHEEEDDDLLEDVDLDEQPGQEEENEEPEAREDEEFYEEEDEFLDEEEEGEEEYVPHKPSIFERPARPYKEVLEEEAEKEHRVKEEQEKPAVRQQDNSDIFEKEQEVPLRESKKSASKSMDIEEFARYAMDYAASIDCSITEKGVTALYERIQLMEEDGIVLNEESARDLIEESADQAEKPSFGKQIGSLFRPKYDKDDKLILREEHFMG